MIFRHVFLCHLNFSWCKYLFFSHSRKARCKECEGAVPEEEASCGTAEHWRWPTHLWKFSSRSVLGLVLPSDELFCLSFTRIAQTCSWMRTNGTFISGFAWLFFMWSTLGFSHLSNWSQERVSALHVAHQGFLLELLGINPQVEFDESDKGVGHLRLKDAD